MYKEIRRRLAPPVFEDDEKTRVARLLNAILLTMLAATASELIFSLFLNGETLDSLAVSVIGVVILLTCGLLALVRWGHIRPAVMLLCLGMWAIFTYASLHLGGLLNPAFGAFILVIVIAGLMAGGKAAVGFAILSAVTGLFILSEQLSGALPGPDISLPALWTAQSLLFALIAVIHYLASQSLSQALTRARLSEEALAQRNRQLEHEISERKQAEESLRQSHESVHQFMDKLNALHEVSIKLSKAASFDELCRRAVELGRTRLGFDRLSLWFPDSDPQFMVGSFGTDENGQVRDEHLDRVKITFEDRMDEVLDRLVLVSKTDRNVPLYDENLQIVGLGWQAAGKLWDGDTNIGWLFTDNLLQKQPLSESLLKLLALYAATVGHLVTRQRAEETLRENEERYRLVSELVSDYAYAYRIEPDGNWKMDWLIGTPEGLTGFEMNVLRGTHRVFHPEDDERARLDVLQSLEGASTEGDYRVIAKNDEVRWLHILRQPIWNAKEQRFDRFYAAVQDITERKRVEEELISEHNLLRTLIDTIPDQIYVKDRDSRFIIANPATATYMDVESAEAMIGKTDFDFFTQEVAQIYFDDEQALIHSGQNVLKFESFSLGPTGQLCWLLVTKVPYRDSQGKIIGLVGTNHDITERKHTEEQALELALARQRAESLTNFLSTMSHDLKTPLTVMNTSLYLLERLTDPARQQDKIKNIRTQTQLLEKYIQDILTISRLDHLPVLVREVVNLNHLLGDIAERLRASAEQKNQTLTLDLAQETLLVSGDKKELDRVLVNLIENAVIYTPADGSIVVRTRLDGDDRVVEVIDSGMGISESDLPRIFDRFYRAKEALAVESRGTGLGLAIVSRIIEMHGGKIEVESAVGKGSTFRVYLPTGAAPLRLGEAAPPQPNSA